MSTTPTALGHKAPPAVRVVDAFVAFSSGARTVMALRGADLTLAAGERLVVEGPNGSGKTTLLRVITGEQPVVAGLVEVGGTALHRLSRAERHRWRARSVGFVDQHARRNLLPELSVLRNVGLQLELTDTPRTDASRRAADLLEELGLAELSHRAVNELSGGEAQRIAIGAAVAHRPELVLADEPTGELDDEAARGVYALLSRIAARGTSLIMVCHDRRAEAFTDRVVRIRDGRLAEQWRPDPDGAQQDRRPEPTQVVDSRGWIRLPAVLLASGPLQEVAVAPVDGGVLLKAGRPARSPAPKPELTTHGHPSGGSPVLTASGLTIGYPTRTLAEGIELTVRPGETLAVAGAAGTGKTTLLHVLAGLLDPLAGKVLVGAAPWPDDSTRRTAHRRHWLAFAAQQPALLEAMTVGENLQLTTQVRGRNWSSKQTGELLAALDLAPLVDQEASRLSGGERQRLGLARALASGAPLLLLDEPTSQQDDASADLIVAALAATVTAGRAVVVTSHDPRCLSPATRLLRLESNPVVNLGRGLGG